MKILQPIKGKYWLKILRNTYTSENFKYINFCNAKWIKTPLTLHSKRIPFSAADNEDRRRYNLKKKSWRTKNGDNTLLNPCGVAMGRKQDALLPLNEKMKTKILAVEKVAKNDYRAKRRGFGINSLKDAASMKLSGLRKNMMEKKHLYNHSRAPFFLFSLLSLSRNVLFHW